MTREEALRKIKGYLTDLIPQEDYTEVEEIVKALEQQPCPYWDYGLNTCRHANIGALATVTPIRPKVEWETGYTYPDGEYWKCSVCKELIRVRFPMHFCPNCSADMRGEKDAT